MKLHKCNKLSTNWTDCNFPFLFFLEAITVHQLGKGFQGKLMA